MRKNSAFIAAALIASAVPVSALRAEDTGTRVLIRLAEGGTLPDAEKVVEALQSQGANQQVLARVNKKDGKEELSLDLWGNWVPSAQIPQTLRDGFPELSGAEIEVSSLDPAARPNLDSLKVEGTGQRIKIIKKKESP